ncbi:hypothetical protein BX266_3567 [Streptomyces sp. TLI_171]|nr:hypothetical protein BX266_3567 [Streptomyces sp. TLI_171]
MVTADRIPTRPARRRFAVLPVVLGTALGAAACTGSDGGGSDAALSYASVRSTAEQLGSQGGAACPFGLDLAAALKSAGIDRTATPGAADAKAAEGEVAEATAPVPWPSWISPSPTTASAPGRPPSARVTCVWTVGSTPVQLDLTAVPLDDVGVNMVLPSIQSAGEVSVDQLSAIVTGRPKPGGKPLVTPGEGLAAIARVRAKGTGDIVLVLSQDSPDRPDRSLTGEPLGRLLDRLAGQIRS